MPANVHRRPRITIARPAITPKDALEILTHAGLATPEGCAKRLAHVTLEKLSGGKLELRFVAGQVCAVDGLPQGEYCRIFDSGFGWTITYHINGRQIYLGPSGPKPASLQDTFEEFKRIRQALEVILAPEFDAKPPGVSE